MPPITVETTVSPSFSLGPLSSDGVNLTVSSTSTFGELFPRSEYALFMRVTTIEGISIPQPIGKPLTDTNFTVYLPKDGVYKMQLVAFLAEDVPSTFGRATGTVIYDKENEWLSVLEEQKAERYFNSTTLSSITTRQIPYASTTLTYLHLQPGKNRRAELVSLLLDKHMMGKQKLEQTFIGQLRREIQDYELALEGAEYEFSFQRYAECQRILKLLDKLRSDSCTC